MILDIGNILRIVSHDCTNDLVFKPSNDGKDCGEKGNGMSS